jgi:hypothetical protein
MTSNKRSYLLFIINTHRGFRFFGKHGKNIRLESLESLAVTLRCHEMTRVCTRQQGSRTHQVPSAPVRGAQGERRHVAICGQKYHRYGGSSPRKRCRGHISPRPRPHKDVEQTICARQNATRGAGQCEKKTPASDRVSRCQLRMPSTRKNPPSTIHLTQNIINQSSNHMNPT